MYKIKSSKDCYDGMMVICNISDIIITEARLKIDNEKIYICQNEMSGNPIYPRFGFDYSWIITDGQNPLNESDLKSLNVRSLEKHPDSDKLILNK